MSLRRPSGGGRDEDRRGRARRGGFGPRLVGADRGAAARRCGELLPGDLSAGAVPDPVHVARARFAGPGRGGALGDRSHHVEPLSERKRLLVCDGSLPRASPGGGEVPPPRAEPVGPDGAGPSEPADDQARRPTGEAAHRGPARRLRAKPEARPERRRHRRRRPRQRRVRHPRSSSVLSRTRALRHRRKIGRRGRSAKPKPIGSCRTSSSATGETSARCTKRQYGPGWVIVCD